MSRKNLFRSLAILIGAMVLSISNAQAQLVAPDLFSQTVKARLTFLFDNSGSMDEAVPGATGVCACYGDGSHPGLVKYDCDGSGTVGDTADCNLGGLPCASRMDVAVGIARILMDTNNSAAACPGDKTTSIDTGDDMGLEFGFFHFKNSADPVAAPTAPPALDIETLTPPGSATWPPTINPQSRCAGGDTKLRLRARSISTPAGIAPFIDIMQPSGFTPNASSLLYMRTDNSAFPTLSATTGPNHDPYFACREDSVVLLTDGDETCTNVENMVTEAFNLWNYSASKKISVHIIGFGNGLSEAGRYANARAALFGHTDANGDGDNNPATMCDPRSANIGQHLTFDPNNPATAPTSVTDLARCGPSCTPPCGGNNAWEPTTPQQLIGAFRSITGNLNRGKYMISPAQLTFSTDGTDELLISYFGVKDLSLTNDIFTGHLEAYKPDPIDPDNYTCVGCQLFDIINAIPAQTATNRRHYTLGTTGADTGKLIEFNEANIPSKIPLTDFFPASSPTPTPSATPSPDPVRDFNRDGVEADSFDGKDIARWLRGETTSSNGAAPAFQWGNGANYVFNEWPTGSIIHPEPILAGAAQSVQNLLRQYYDQYVINTALRDRVVVYPNNSGSIAFINYPANDDTSPYGGSRLAKIGEEAFAYVPVAVRTNLARIRHVNQEFFGKITKADVFVPGGTSVNDWQSRIYATGGLGGNYIIGLNATYDQIPDFYGCIATNSCPGPTDNKRHWEVAPANLGNPTAKVRIINVFNSVAGTYPANTIVSLLVVPGGALRAGALANPDNSRYLYFIDAITGNVVREMPMQPLTGNNVGNQMDYPGNPLPIADRVNAGMETRVAITDVNGDGLVDVLFVGGNDGDIKRVDIWGSLQNITNTTNIGIPVWLSRDLNNTVSPDNNFNGNGNGILECPTPGSNCEAAAKVGATENPRDLPVAGITPYVTPAGNALRLLVFFGKPLGKNSENAKSSRFPRGGIVRDIDAFAVNSERRIPDTANLYPGPTRLPRENWDTGTSPAIADIFWDVDNAFVLNNIAYYLIHRNSNPCSSGSGTTYLVGIDLATGEDVDVNLSFSGTISPVRTNEQSTSNYLQVTDQGPANMKIDFRGGTVTFGYVDKSGGAGNHKMVVSKKKPNIPWPPNGVIGSVENLRF